MHFLGVLYHFEVCFHFGLVMDWEYFLVAAHDIRFLLVPLGLGLPEQLLPSFPPDDVPSTRLDPFPDYILSPLKKQPLVLAGDAHELEGVHNQPLLDLVVQGSAGLEAGGVVDLNQVGLQVRGDHDVHPQNVEAHVVLELLRLAVLVLVRYRRQSANKGLHYHLLYVLLKCFYIIATPSQMLVSRS